MRYDNAALMRESFVFFDGFDLSNHENIKTSIDSDIKDLIILIKNFEYAYFILVRHLISLFLEKAFGLHSKISEIYKKSKFLIQTAAIQLRNI
jgi:hypothetical protein